MFSFMKMAAALILTSFITTGCVNVATSKVNPQANLAAIKTMYVQHYESDNSGVNEEIATQLQAKGVFVTTGAGAPPKDVDAVVFYVDKWRWDITMYMLELTVTIKDAKTNQFIATGDSVHTSLTRKSQKDMVTEVINNIYANQPLVTH